MSSWLNPTEPIKKNNSDGSAETDCIVAGCGQQQELLFTPGGTTEGAG